MKPKLEANNPNAPTGVLVQPVVSTREHDFLVAHLRYKAAERSTNRVQTNAGAMALAVTLNRLLKAAELLAEEIGERANDGTMPRR